MEQACRRKQRLCSRIIGAHYIEQKNGLWIMLRGVKLVISDAQRRHQGYRRQGAQ